MIAIFRKYSVLFLQVTLNELHKFIYDFFKIYTIEIVAGFFNQNYDQIESSRSNLEFNITKREKMWLKGQANLYIFATSILF